jgi:hypothetical protein
MNLESELARTISRNLDDTTPRRGRPAATSEGWRRVAHFLSLLLAVVIVALIVSLGASRAMQP